METPMAKLNQYGMIPLYEQLKKAIKKDICTKKYRPGDKLPSEKELEEIYSVSRITVRRAVEELCAENILSKKQGKGTFVLGGEFVAQLTVGNVGFHQRMNEAGLTPQTQILEKAIIEMPAAMANDLHLVVGEKTVYLKRLLFADGRPMAIDICYLPLSRFPGVFEKLEGEVSVFETLDREYDTAVERFRKIIRAKKASKETAHLLGGAVGDPVFEMTKLVFDSSDSPCMISVSYLLGSNTYYVIDNAAGQMNSEDISWRV